MQRPADPVANCEQNADNGALDSAPTLQQLAACTQQQFETQYGHSPEWTVAAPGRVNLIGEHTDYNDGFVLPMAIDRYVVMVGGRRQGDNGAIRLHSAAIDKTESLQLGSTAKDDVDVWARYVLGVLVGCQTQGLEAGPLNIAINSTVPLGGGLSSSAALEVATATLMEAATGKSLDKIDKALLCQKAEHDYAGVPCGIMDQFTSVLGQDRHLMLLDCRSTDVQMVPLEDPDVLVLIINTNVKHELTGGEYAERRSQCEAAAKTMGVSSLREATMELLGQCSATLEPVHLRRARHVIGEIQRTTEAAREIAAGNWPRVGELMYASHASLRDDYEVSCEELDILVDLAQEIGSAGGVIGSRMTGGGFGGCTVTLVRRDQVESVAARISEAYQQRTGICPTLFTTPPAQGAHVVA